MKPARAIRPILFSLASTALLCLPMACGKKAYVAPSGPLPNQIEIAFKRNLFDTNAFLRPYESARLLLTGPGLTNFPPDTSLWLDPASSLDGQPIPEDRIKYLQFGHNSFTGHVSLGLGPEFQPWSILPRKTGAYTFNLVLHTELEKWVCPSLVVTIRATEDEARLIAEFEASGASQFLDHPFGARRASEAAAPALPYGALADFVQKHPDSYLLEAVQARIKSLFLQDINSVGAYTDGPLLPDDRQVLATILGRIDPHFVKLATEVQEDYLQSLATSRNPEQTQQRIDICAEWLRLATAASAQQGRPQ